MAIPHRPKFAAPHLAERVYPLGVCSVARESVICAGHLRATAADLCGEFHDLRAHRDRLIAKDRLACGRVDCTRLLTRGA
jgi:hypothetical protein